MPRSDTAFDRALTHFNRGELAQSWASLKPAVVGGKASTDAVHLAAAIHMRLGEVDRALYYAQEAARRDPGVAGRHNTLGAVLHMKGSLDRACASFEESIRLDPRDPQPRNNYAQALRDLLRFTEAEASLRAALELKQGERFALCNLATLLLECGRASEAAALLKGAGAGRPDDHILLRNYVSTLNYLDSVSPSEVFQAHMRYGKALAAAMAPIPARAAPGATEQNRAIRVGFLSADLRAHSVAFFLEPLLAHLDRDRYFLAAYSTAISSDATTARLKPQFRLWRDAAGLDDRKLADLIRADRIDILIDLAGLTAGGRPGVLALRPARTQATYLGYPNTTGVPNVDWRIVDNVTDPSPGADGFACERLLRIEGCFLCYRPPSDAPDVAPPASSTGRPVTFGSFNSVAKIGPRTIRLWSRVLLATPGSRLLLKSRPFGEAPLRERFLAAFEAHGVARDRIELLGHTSDLAGHLGLYHSMDIALDTFPYNGATTTCDALWMGVPVITLEGDRHAARVGATILRAAGVDECVATNEDDFIATASLLAQSPARLRDLRAFLRDRVRASSLCDEPTFTRRFERVLESMLAPPVGG